MSIKQQLEICVTPDKKTIVTLNFSKYFFVTPNFIILNQLLI
jgi:hypothetical protein